MKFTNKILLTGTLFAAAGAFALQTSGSSSAGQASQVPSSPSSPSAQYPSSQSPSTQTPPSSQPGTPGSTAPGSPQGAAPSAQPEQAPHPGRPSIDDQVKMLSQELSLNTDQQAKLKNILEDQHQQAMTFVNDASMSREDKIQKIRVLREATITKARGIMNDDQKKKLDAMLQQQQQQGMHSGAAPGNPPSSNPPSSNPPTSSSTPPK